MASSTPSATAMTVAVPSVSPPSAPFPPPTGGQLPSAVTLTGTRIDFSALPSAVIVDLQAGTVVGGGVPPFHIPTNLTSVIGTGHGDIIFGNSLPDAFSESGGNNILIGRSGGATFTPGPGSNIVVGAGTGNTVSYLHEGAVQVNLANHFAVKSAGADQLTGINNVVGSYQTDILVGNSGNNVIDGVYGNDTMTGGGGHDTFVFTERGSVPTITDFQTGDTLQFHRTEVFPPVGMRPPPGVLPPQDFTIGTHATTPSQIFIFNPNDQTLYYDADGSGSQFQPYPLVHLPGATINAGDIVAM